jgi:uncharacterized phage protein (TIGR02218 family)
MANAIVSKGSKNRLVSTEDFTAAAWTTTGTGSRTANHANNPFGAMTADLLDDTGAGDLYLVRQDFTVPTLDAGEMDLFTVSVYVKPNTAAATRFSLYHTGASGPRVDLRITWATMFQLESLSNSPLYGDTDVRTSPAENGFHRISITIRYQSAFGPLRFEISPAGVTVTNTGSVWVWGAQLEQYQAMTSYVAVTGTTDPLAGTYRTLAQAVAATGGTLGALEKLQLRDEEYEIQAGLVLNAVTTTALYRIIEPAPGVANYDPVQNTGPRIVIRNWPTGGTNGGLVVQENNFVMRGVGVFHDWCARPASSSATNAMLYINGADAGRYWDCFFDAERGGGDGVIFFVGIYLEGAAGAKALSNNFYDCVVKGGRPSSNRGLDTGILWGNFAEKGGAYGCAFYGCNIGVQSLTKETVVGKTAAFNAPRIHNCISNTYLGVWKRFSHNVSEDDSALGSTNRENPADDTALMQIPDPDSKGNIGGSVLWLDADRNDFRPRPGSLLIDAGSNQTLQYTNTEPPDGSGILSGPGDTNDIAGAPRGTTWDIGPYEGAGLPVSTAFSVVIKTVGKDPSRDFSSIASFLKAVPRSLYWANQRWVANLIDDGVPDDMAHGIQFEHFDCICGTSTRVELTAAKNYDVKSKAGYKLRCDTSVSLLARHRALLWWTVPHSRLTGFAVHQTANAGPTRNCRGIELFSNLCTVDALYFLFDGTIIRFATYALEIEGNGNLVTNNVMRGSDTVGQGSARGIVITPSSQRNRILYNTIYRQQGGSTGGGTGAKSHGIVVGDGAIFTRLSGNIVCEVATLNGTGAEDYAFGAGITAEQTMDHCISEDATAAGIGSLVSQSAAAVFKNASNGDFRLKPGSPALNKGTNFSDVFSRDQTGKGRISPFDIGAYEGVASPPLMVTPDSKDHHRRCLLFEVVRLDGGMHLYTSSSEPLEHAGQLYLPSGQVSASALRREVALKEQSLELQGAIVTADISAAALAAGLYRGARVTRRVVDWRYPWTEPFRKDVFRIAKVGFDQEVWTADLVGPTIMLDQRVGEQATVSCSTRLGTEDCGVNLPAFSEYNVQVGTVLNARREFTCVISQTRANDFFGLGKVSWITGPSAGLQVDVKTSFGSGTTQTLKLIQKSPFVITSGDRFDLQPGCRLRYIADCITKYGNGPNFQGRPYLIGSDRMLDTPTR